MSTPQNNAKTTPGRRGRGRPFQPGNSYRIKPGECRNPHGRPKQKAILETLREIVEQNPELAKQIAHNALRQAARNLGWFTEVRDMLDGKVTDGKPSGGADDPVNYNLYNFTVRFKDAR